jgi:hypothetical protein
MRARTTTTEATTRRKALTAHACVSLARSDAYCSTCGETYEGEGMKRFARDCAFDAVVANALRGARAEDVDAAEDARALRALFDVFGYRGVQVFRSATDAERSTNGRATPTKAKANANADANDDARQQPDGARLESRAHAPTPTAMFHVTLRPRPGANSANLEFPFCSIPRDASCGVLRRVVEYEVGREVVIYDAQDAIQNDVRPLCEMFASELERVAPMVAWFGFASAE